MVKVYTDNPSIIAGLKEGRERRKEAKKESSKRMPTWAVDFDGTLCSKAWPDIGAPNTDLIEALKMAKASGVRLILWTSREDAYLRDAVNWCAEMGLVFDAVNDNLPEYIGIFGNNPRKIGADLYIDDRAFPWWGNGKEGNLCSLTQKVTAHSNS